MKYFVISDVHGSKHYLDLAYSKFIESKADYLICLGDFYYHGPRNPLPEGYDPMKVSELFNSINDKLLPIRGNCDAEVDQMISTFIFKDNISITLENGYNVYLHHGHKDIIDLDKYQLVLSGHTHIGLIKKEDNVIYANPGSISLPKSTDSRSYIILDEKSIQRISLLDGNLIEEIIF